MHVQCMRSEILESVNDEKLSRHAHDDSYVLRLIARITSRVQASFMLQYVFSKGTKPKILLKKLGVTNIKKPQNLKGFTMNLTQGVFKQCSHVQIFLLFCRTNPYG